jgi:CheY-like chemotaxis protein
MYKILVIDDDPNIRFTTKAVLEALTDWDILLAASGHEGLLVARQKRPDAVLLDVIMPGLGGITVLEYLHANAATQQIPVILFTSVSQESFQRQLARLSLAGVILKPFEPTDLVTQIRSLLKWDT